MDKGWRCNHGSWVRYVAYSMNNGISQREIYLNTLLPFGYYELGYSSTTVGLIVQFFKQFYDNGGKSAA